MAAYTVKDFVVAIRENDTEAIANLASKYPVLFAKIAAAVALAPDAMADVAELIGDATTGIKMNNAAKAVWGAEGASKATETADVDEDTDEDEKPVETAPKRRGRPRKAVTEEAAEKPAPKRRGRPKKQPEPVEEAEDTDEGEDNPYEGMKAPELYKTCKQRGIDTKPRQKAQVYIDLLMADDAKADDDDNDDEDDWDI